MSSLLPPDRRRDRPGSARSVSLPPAWPFASKVPDTFRLDGGQIGQGDSPVEVEGLVFHAAMGGDVQRLALTVRLES